jgi:predicted phosphoribosyltransferase
MFRDREDAACQLAAKLRDYELKAPLVLAIPRGGVITGAALAREIGAELDVVLSRKLRAPNQPELAFGGISENGEVYLNGDAAEASGVTDEYFHDEKEYQLAVIAFRKQRIRRVRPKSPIQGRSVIVTDDGVATGSTMIAALNTVRSEQPAKLIVAVPVAPADRVRDLEKYCDEVVCLCPAEHFWSIGQFYKNFPTVDDDQVVGMLRDALPQSARLGPWARSAPPFVVS